MKTSMLLSIALLGCATAHVQASPPTQAEPAQRVYTYALELAANGAVSAIQPHGFQADATSRKLDTDIRSWIFEPAAPGSSSSMSTYLRVVTQLSVDSPAGFEVVSATTGPAPRSLAQPDFPLADQMDGREGTVVLALTVGADGKVVQARVHNLDGSPSRAMASAALKAAGSWTFSPEIVDGQAVQGRLLWPVCYLGPSSSVADCSWSGPDAQRLSSKTVLTLDPAVKLVAPVALQ